MGDADIGVVPSRPLNEEDKTVDLQDAKPLTAEEAITDPQILNAVSHFPGILGIDANPNQAKYIIKKIAGGGAGGTAFLVQRVVDGQRFVAKLTDLSHVTDAKRRLYARNEIHCLKQCDHFAIIKHHESCQNEAGTHLLLIMELADAGDLSRAIKARAKHEQYFAEHEVAFLFLQVVLGIDFIHRRNMLHRDIKSANVFILSCGITKVGDFGFSQQYHHSVSDAVAGTFCGTPFYLAPELWQRQAYSNRADMWSLGVLLYEIAALRRPFAGRDLRSLMNRVMECSPEPLPAMYSDTLQEVVMSLLAFDPRSRPNCQQLLAMPYMTRTMQLFEGVIASNTNISEEMKAKILRQVNEAKPSNVPRSPSESGLSMQSTASRAQSNNTTPQSAPRPPATGGSSDVLARGPVKKLGSRGWKDRILTLSNSAITVSVEANRGGEEKSLTLDQVTGVLPVSPTQVDNREGVFLINTAQGSQVLFQAKDVTDRTQWIERILEALSARAAVRS